MIRNATALLLVCASLAYSGAMIQAGGFGGWVIALVLSVMVPLIVCLTASRAPILFGFLSATAQSVSVFVHHPRYRSQLWTSESWERFVASDLGTSGILLALFLGLSLVSSIPMSLQRRHRAAFLTDS